MAFDRQENYVQEKVHEAVLRLAQLLVEKRMVAAGSMRVLWERDIGSAQVVQGLQGQKLDNFASQRK